MIKLKFFGLGGQGIVTAAKTLSEAVSIYEEEYAITVPAYGHERRGAPVNTSIMIDSKPVLLNCFVYEPEIVLVSDASFLTREIDIGAGISENAVLVLNTGDEGIAGQFKEKFGFKEVYYADATRIAVKNIKRNIPNSAMLGVLARTGIVKIESVMAAVKSTFGTKAGSANADAAKETYDETGKI